MTEKKSPNNITIPKLSIIKPKNDLPVRIKTMPNARSMVPLTFCGLVKNTTVFNGPIMRTRPITNKTFPNANNAASKNVITPRMKKNSP